MINTINCQIELGSSFGPGSYSCMHGIDYDHFCFIISFSVLFLCVPWVHLALVVYFALAHQSKDKGKVPPGCLLAEPVT